MELFGGVHGCEKGDCYSSETDIGQNASLAPFVSMFLFPFSAPFPLVPASGYLWDGEERKGEDSLFRSPAPFPRGAMGCFVILCLT